MLQSPYNFSYPHVYTMQALDDQTPFLRWWKNFSTEKHPPYIPATHWVIIEPQQRVTSRGKTVTYYLATIGADHEDWTTTCTFEPGIPPPPAYFYPATEKYTPPPPAKPLTERERAAKRLRNIVADAQWELYRKTNPYTPPPPPAYRFN